MKEIRLDVFILAGIILFLLGTTMLFVMYFNREGYNCIADPVEYANINNESYWWNTVAPIDYNRWTPSD